MSGGIREEERRKGEGRCNVLVRTRHGKEGVKEEGSERGRIKGFSTIIHTVINQLAVASSSSMIMAHKGVFLSSSTASIESGSSSTHLRTAASPCP